MIEITEVRVSLRDDDKLKAFISITLNDSFVIRGLKVIKGNSGVFVAMPSRKRPDGQWAVTQQLPAGRYKYKLIVDGKWISDPENPVQAEDDTVGKSSVVVIGH